ncbi:MAG: hypothetical protein R3C97_15435 [Geminicoccaceae bacterium]
MIDTVSMSGIGNIGRSIRRPRPGSLLMFATMALALVVFVLKAASLFDEPGSTAEIVAEASPSRSGGAKVVMEEPPVADWSSIIPSAGGEGSQADPGPDVADIVAAPDRGLLEERERTLDLASTDALEDVAADLQRRQADLDKREAEVALREQALAATRAKLDEQLDRLEALRAEISGMIEKVEADEEARLQQLVAIYEKMKGKEAAQIFDRLDPDVMLKVAVRMREAKLATILAKMDTARARYLTAELAKQLELPTVEP